MDFNTGAVITPSPSFRIVPVNVRQTELGKQLLAIRRKAIAKGLQLKSTDEILAEIRADRGD